MKTIGLLGGMSWESTLEYYRIINETVNGELGGLHSAKILLYSVDFDEIERYQSSGQWERAAAVLSDAAGRLEAAGADFLVICTNTLHKLAPEISAALSIPLLHIAVVTAAKLKEAGVGTVGLLGTSYTMMQRFYTEVLEREGIRVLLPDTEEIESLDAIIFRELCRGIVRDGSRKIVRSIMDRLQSRGAQGVVLGCTELGMLVGQKDAKIPVFDTTALHAREAAQRALR